MRESVIAGKVGAETAGMSGPWQPGNLRGSSTSSTQPTPITPSSAERARFRSEIPDDARLVDEIENGNEERADREPKQVQQDQYAPRKVVRVRDDRIAAF